VAILHALVEIVLELFRSAGMAELSQRFCFDLSDPLSRYAEGLSNFLKRSGPAVVKPEAHGKHLALSVGERTQHIVHLLFEHFP
jgi:hypothetical protein